MDILAILFDVGKLESFTSPNTGCEIVKRTVVLVDHTYCTISCVMLEDEARALSYYVGAFATILVRAARVSAYCGRSLTATFASTISYNDTNIPEADLLLGIKQELMCGRRDLIQLTTMTEPGLFNTVCLLVPFSMFNYRTESK